MANPHFVERKACPVCDSDDLGELFRCAYTDPPIRDLLEAQARHRGSVDFSLLEGGDYILDECRSCGLIFQRYVTDEYLGEIVYERWNDPDRALSRRQRSAFRARGRTALEILAIVEFLGSKPEGLRFLDFGMGWGNWAQMAEALGVECYGLDTSSSRVAHAEGHGVKVLSPEELGERSFDFINTEQVFEHLPDPHGTAVDLVRTLEEGGILKISVPNAMRVKRRLRVGDWLAPWGSRRSLNDVAPLQHINAFNHRSLMALGTRAGLRQVRIPARLRYRYSPTWERPSKMLRRTVGQHYRAVRKQETVIWFRRGPGRSGEVQADD